MKEQWIYDQFSTIDVSDARLQRRAVDIAKGCAKLYFKDTEISIESSSCFLRTNASWISTYAYKSEWKAISKI